MNANELADALQAVGTTEVVMCDAAAMIRKQANKIVELEKLVHQRFDDGKRLGVLETENKFKSPPCAWMVKTNDGKKLMLYGEEQPPKFADEVQAIPLYTHPHPDNLGLAESIIKQQRLEIEALKMMLANRNDALDKLDLKSTPCKYTEGM